MNTIMLSVLMGDKVVCESAWERTAAVTIWKRK